jgi:hypothetical protein
MTKAMTIAWLAAMAIVATCRRRARAYPEFRDIYLAQARDALFVAYVFRTGRAP